MAHTDPTRPTDAAPHPVFPWLTEARRAWLYRVLVALGALLVLYGVATATEVAVWLGLAVALSNATPAAHTPTAR